MNELALIMPDNQSTCLRRLAANRNFLTVDSGVED